MHKIKGETRGSPVLLTSKVLPSFSLCDIDDASGNFKRGCEERTYPPADISRGMGIQQQLITALRNSRHWSSSAYILTYGEHGGYFDHVAPPVLDAYGAGMRAPTWVISPTPRNSTWSRHSTSTARC